MSKYASNMTQAEHKELNKKLVPYNIAIAVIALAVTIIMFFGSFFRMNIRLPITEESQYVIMQLISGDDSSDYVGGIDADAANVLISNYTDYDNSTIENEWDNGDFNGGGIFDGGIFDSLNLSGLIGTDLRINISISNMSLINALFSGAIAQTVLAEMLDNIVEQVPELFTVVVVSTVVELVVEIAQDISDEFEVEIPAYYVGRLTEEFLSVFYGQHTYQSFTDALLVIIEGALNALPQLDDYADYLQEILDEVSDMLYYYMEQLFEVIAGESGYVETEILVFSILADLLSIPEPDGGWNPDNASTEIASFILNDLLAGSSHIIDIVFIVMAAMLLVVILAFGLLTLFSIIRLFTKNKRIYLGFARGVGWIPFSLFIILPALAWLILPLIPAIAYGLPAIMSYVSVTFIAMTLAGFVGAVGLMIINIAGYGKKKKMLKQATITDAN